MAGDYTIAGGLADARRLARQARVMEAATEAFLARAGLAAGTAALDDLQAVYGATVRFHGGDPTIGPRLRALLAASGLQNVREVTVENPMTTVGEKLFLAELVRNMRVAVLAAGAATGGELDALEARVEAAARDPAAVFYQAHIHQVWGRRTQ